MTKKLLIISPYFPPTNAADMHRVRTSLPYYAQSGWHAEVATVAQAHVEMVSDSLLKQSLPENLIIHYVQAFDKKYTAKIGLGSIALRSFWHYFRTVNRLLKRQNYDLVFFSTTQFPLLALSLFWKLRFHTKIVFDIQDPWHNDYYQTRPRHERPPKYWFSYNLNRFLEPIAMRAADGLISVSDGYIKTLHQRYSRLKSCPYLVIPFGLHLPDLKIASSNVQCQPSILTANSKFNLVYAGRGGHDLRPAMLLLIKAISAGLTKHPKLFEKLHVHLIGTSYAPAGVGKSTFQDQINEYHLSDMFTETTDRIPFYQTLNTLQQADLLFIAGPHQPDYVASKIFPYLMTGRPILGLFNKQSAAVDILNSREHVSVFTYDQEEAFLISEIQKLLKEKLVAPKRTISISTNTLAQHSSEHYTNLQTRLFDKVCGFNS